jgi:hypothetical protein
LKRIIAVLVAAAMFGSSHAAALASQAVNPNEVSRVVAASNAAGLRTFASAGNYASTSDITVGPALSWYLHDALKIQHRDAATAAIISDLGTDGILLTGRIQARANLKKYTAETAASEHSALGIETTWEPPTTDRSARGPTFFLRAQVKADFAFSPDGDFPTYRREETYVRGTLRGFRVADDRGAATLYIFTDTAARLEAMRHGMNEAVWSDLTDGFGSDIGVLSDLWFDESSSHFESIPDDEAFQLQLGCPFPGQVEETFHTVFSDQHLTYNGTVEAESEDDGSMWAASLAAHDRTMPGHILDKAESKIFSVPGVFVDICHNGDFIGGLQTIGSGLSARVPMIYAIVDHRTGMIVTLAAHTR